MSWNDRISVKRSEFGIKQILEATFPDNRKQTVWVEPTERVTLHGLNWSGGSRSEYRACTVLGQSLPNKYDMSAPAPWNNPFEGKEVNLQPGVVIVQAGYFCGKKSTPTIYVHPQNMPKFLPAPSAAVESSEV